MINEEKFIEYYLNRLENSDYNRKKFLKQYPISNTFKGMKAKDIKEIIANVCEDDIIEYCKNNNIKLTNDEKSRICYRIRESHYLLDFLRSINLYVLIGIEVKEFVEQKKWREKHPINIEFLDLTIDFVELTEETNGKED